MRGVRSEVGTCSAAAMQATRGASEEGEGEGRVATRQRCVWCVRSWWKNVGRSAGKEGASSACGGTWERRFIFSLVVGLLLGVDADVRVVRGRFGCPLR